MDFGCEALMRLDLGGEVTGQCSTGGARVWVGNQEDTVRCDNERATHSTHMSTGSHAAADGDEDWILSVALDRVQLLTLRS